MSLAPFLVNGLKLVCPPKGNKLDVLIGQADLCGGTRLEGVARTAVTTDKHFIVCYLPHTDVQLALLRKYHGRTGQTVGTDGGHHDALGLRIQNRAAGCQRVGRRAGGGRHDNAIAPVVLYQNIIAVNAEVDGLLQASLGHDHIIEGVPLPAVLTKHPGV